MKKILISITILFIIASCANLSPNSLGNLGTGWNFTTAGGKDFIYSPLREQESIFLKSFIFDMEPVIKEFRCGGTCPYTENGVYPRDEDLEKICKLDDPKSSLYERRGVISYTTGVVFSCRKNNTEEIIFRTVKKLTKEKEKESIEFEKYFGDGDGKLFAGRGLAQVKRTRDINVNELKIKSFALELPKNSTSNCDNNYEFLWFEGPVNADTPEIIRRILEDIKVCKSPDGKSIPIIISMFSGGGFLKDGFATGKILRDFETYSLILNGEYCASSCATAFIGSKKREILGDGLIMFHAPYSYDFAALEKGKIEIECQSENLELRNYYVEMLGLEDGPLLYERTMSYCGQDITWSLNDDAAKIFGITNT